jgi:hypothetical protein
MKTFNLFLVIFLLTAGYVFSAPYDMIPAGDPVIEDIRFLSMESGISVLSFTPPFAPHEIEMFLEAIDVDELSLPAQEAYNRIQKRLVPQAPLSISGRNFTLLFNVSSTMEAGLRSNENINWYPLYPKIPPFISLPFRFSFADSLQLYFEPAISMEPEFYRGSNATIYANNDIDVGKFSHNIPSGFHNADLTFPFRAYIAAGNSWWNFQLGRDRLSFGTGQSGNLAISDNPSFYEFARLSFFTDFFKYSVLVSQMPLDIRGIYDVDGTTNPTATTQRYFYLHRVDFSLFDVLTIGITEGVIVGNSALELRYLNPFMIFHSLFSFWDYPGWNGGTNAPLGTGDMNGSLFSLEINWNIMKSLALYGQFVMNQYATAYEIETWGNPMPNGLGYLAGLRYSHSFGGWGSIFSLEFVYTDPYLYYNPSPFASHIHMRQLGISPGRFLYSFYGYSRDVIVTTLGANFFKGDQLSLSGNFSWVIQGEHGLFYDWEESDDAFAETTPTGTPENNFIASLSMRWKINSMFTLNGGITCIFSQNHAHEKGNNEFGVQAVVSVNFSY